MTKEDDERVARYFKEYDEWHIKRGYIRKDGGWVIPKLTDEQLKQAIKKNRETYIKNAKAWKKLHGGNQKK